MVRSLLTVLVLVNAASGQVVLKEPYTPGAVYGIKTRVELTGRLAVPAGPNQTPSEMTVRGTSTIDYDERLLAPLADRPGPRSVRVYRSAEVKRTVGPQAQQTTLRPVVRRMVVLRQGTREVPFSPDGPLTFGEIDLVRTDVYTPALVGLLPNRPVQVGERWSAANSAIEELTDMEKIDEGGVECRLEAVNGRVATVRFSGGIRGVNEDGPNRQQLDGSFTFDLDGHYLSALSLTGVHLLLDAQGQPKGRVEGTFSLNRRPVAFVPELADSVLKIVSLEPNPTNTLLVYEGSGAGVRFLYPRRWRVSAEHGRQITLDGPAGNGVLITAEVKEKVPTAGDFLRETQAFLLKQKGKVGAVDAPQRVQPAPRELDRFALDVTLDGKPVRMEYYVARQATGGATIAARLAFADAGELRPDIDGIARSLSVPASGIPGVVPIPRK